MKVLNLYAGTGGNRRAWLNCDVTAIELAPKIAKIYQGQFPEDKVIVTDAHAYLLKHYKEFDFIWSSPPCPSHSRARFWNTKAARIYPDLKLYEEILFLQTHFKGKFAVENVIPYYQPLLPAVKLGRHLFWCNFTLGSHQFEPDNVLEQPKNSPERNEVNPEIGLYILNCARNIITHENVNQIYLYE